MGIHSSQKLLFCLKFCEEDHSIYCYVFVYLFLRWDVHVGCYKSVALGGGVTLGGGWMTVLSNRVKNL